MTRSSPKNRAKWLLKQKEHMKSDEPHTTRNLVFRGDFVFMPKVLKWTLLTTSSTFGC
jgi:hypothetical protein